MPITPTYPGVYVEEIPSGARTITGVSTSVAAFIGRFRQGVLNTPIELLNSGDFERELGGLDTNSEAGFAIDQFFLAGGTQAYAVRVANGASASSIAIPGEGGGTALEVEAGQAFVINDETEHLPGATETGENPGEWGDNLRIRIDYPEPTSGTSFNLIVELVAERNGRLTVVRSEEFLNLSMTSTDDRYVQTIVNDRFGGSDYVRVNAFTGQGRPVQCGTTSADLSSLPTFSAATGSVEIAIGDITAESVTATVWSAPDPAPGSLEELRVALQEAIRAANGSDTAFTGATVSIVDDRLRVLSGAPEHANHTVRFAAGLDSLGRLLGLTDGPTDLEGVMSGDVSAFIAGPPSGDLTLPVSVNGAPGVDVVVNVDSLAGLDDLAERLQVAMRGHGDVSISDAIVVPRDDDDRLIVLSPQGAVVFETGGDSDQLRLLAADGAVTMEGLLSGSVSSDDLQGDVDVTLDDGTADTQTAQITTAATSLDAKATALQAGIRASGGAGDAWGLAVVGTFTAGDAQRLVLVPGLTGFSIAVAAATGDATSVVEMGLDTALATVADQRYALTGGDNGNAIGLAELRGSESARSGYWALEDCDLFNILCIPRAAELGIPDAATIMQLATAYCEQRRAIYMVDPPTDVNTPTDIRLWLEGNDVRHRNAAIYFPRITIADATNDFRPRDVVPCGTMAGLFAKTDATRGVWKAPAGIEAGLTGVSRLNYEMTDAENGTLNPLGINCLRRFPVYGQVSWGARTLMGADIQASEWKYLPVRRTALYIQESLFRGTKWAVFEPNDEPLWSQIRVSVTAFMHRLYRQGAFQGSSPKVAYLVRCDSATTTQNDIDLGIVNIVVGFRPLKVAEFIILQIQQLAGSD